MRRALVLGLTLLLVAGCTAPIRAQFQTMQTQYAALQNPRYPGDANKDLVPYQARERDSAACSWDKETRAASDADVDRASLPSDYSGAVAGGMKIAWAAHLDCMARRGWR